MKVKVTPFLLTRLSGSLADMCRKVSLRSAFPLEASQGLNPVTIYEHSMTKG